MSENVFNGKFFRSQNEFGDNVHIYCFRYIKETSKYEITVTEDVNNFGIRFALNKEELDELINMLVSIKESNLDKE